MINNKVLYIFGLIFLLISSTIITSANILQNENLDGNLSVANTQAKWTVMYYMCGDSSMDVYIAPLLENLSKIGSDEELNIVCLVDRIGCGNSKLAYISETGERIELNEMYGWPDEVDMGDLNTLELFCIQMMKSFPAEHYALITYAPGGTGWQEYCLTDTDGNNVVTIPAFANSLRNITDDGKKKVDVLYTSCCMSTVELTYEFAPYINYLVTTQEHIPHPEVILRYYPAVWDLRNNTEMTPEEFANRAAFRFEAQTFQYFESYEMKLSPLTKIFNKLPFSGLHTVIMHSSVTVVNLSKIDDLVKSIHNLSSFLILHSHNNDVAKALKISRCNTREFGEAYPKFSVYNLFYERLPLEMFSYDCRIDLYNFVELLRDHIQNSMIIHLCSSVMEKINESIPAIKKVSGDPSNGLNIYFPRSNIMYNKYLSRGKIPCPYENLKFSKDTSWDEFLKSYLNI